MIVLMTYTYTFKIIIFCLHVGFLLINIVSQSLCVYNLKPGLTVLSLRVIQIIDRYESLENRVKILENPTPFSDPCL